MTDETLMCAPNGRCLFSLWWGWIDDQHIINLVVFAGACCLSPLISLPLYHNSLDCWLPWPHPLRVYNYNTEPTLSFFVSGIITKSILGPFGHWTSGSTWRGFSAHFGMGDCHMISRPFGGILWRYGGEDPRRHPRPIFWSSGDYIPVRLENSVQDMDEGETSTEYQF